MGRQCVDCENNYFNFIAKYHQNNEVSIYLQNYDVVSIEVHCSVVSVEEMTDTSGFVVHGKGSQKQNEDRSVT